MGIPALNIDTKYNKIPNTRAPWFLRQQCYGKSTIICPCNVNFTTDNALDCYCVTNRRAPTTKSPALLLEIIWYDSNFSCSLCRHVSCKLALERGWELHADSAAVRSTDPLWIREGQYPQKPRGCRDFITTKMDFWSLMKAKKRYFKQRFCSSILYMQVLGLFSRWFFQQCCKIWAGPVATKGTMPKYP